MDCLVVVAVVVIKILEFKFFFKKKMHSIFCKIAEERYFLEYMFCDWPHFICLVLCRNSAFSDRQLRKEE